ncbi:hypothetical protein TNCV_1430941 [Trichonephila clavipes]|nr:hypothetical protein TNCV_1430941 [Trichonephila clavipes]
MLLAIQRSQAGHWQQLQIELTLIFTKEENVSTKLRRLGADFTLSSPPGGATAYQLLHRSINRQVGNRVAKNDANLALSPTFRYVSIELLL